MNTNHIFFRQIIICSPHTAFYYWSIFFSVPIYQQQADTSLNVSFLVITVLCTGRRNMTKTTCTQRNYTWEGMEYTRLEWNNNFNENTSKSRCIREYEAIFVIFHLFICFMQRFMYYSAQEINKTSLVLACKV